MIVKQLIGKLTLKTVFLMTMAVLPVVTATAWSQELWTPPQIKMIDLSWSNPTVDFLAKNVQDIEKSCPLDGVTVRFGGINAETGKKFIASGAMNKSPWKYESFQKDIELYKTIKFTKLTDNFFYTTVSPGNAEWFSDADWAAVCGNYGIAARIAKETGMRGICFDIEEYGIKFWDFSTIKTGQSYEDAYKIARKRGQEWGKAVFAAYPEVAVLALHMMSYGNKATSLTVPFFNGVMSVMPKTATLHDGLESASYHAKQATDYDRMMTLLYRQYLNRVEKSNLDVYRTQVKMAPGYYLDGIYPTKKESYWHRILVSEIKDDPNGFLRRILMSGVKVADEFVWIYGEKGAWWKGTSFQTWEERSPGITAAVLSVKDPYSLDLSTRVNLMKNPEFKEKKKNWSFWQIEQEKKGTTVPGKGFEQEGLLKIQGVTSGCFTQQIAVEPGKTYLFRVTARYETATSGFCSGTIAFMDKNKVWNNMSAKQNMMFMQKEQGAWSTKLICFTVPQDSYFASVQMGANNLGKDGIVAFQNIALYEL
ncbi:MAG: hypothetical protein PHQ75_05215 [Thermoguttaceae bacterium]|nr:hypothetical protein [Thermoguttaceae bacterium]